MTGPAVIWAKGQVYICEHAETCSGAVTFRGQLRVRDLAGERLYPPKTLTLPVRRVERIEWQEQAVAA